jgi:hypothetical protein
MMRSQKKLMAPPSCGSTSMWNGFGYLRGKLAALRVSFLERWHSFLERERKVNWGIVVVSY